MTDRPHRPGAPERDPASTWDALERLAAEEDARELEAMTPDARDAELRAHGIDPARAALVGQDLLEKAARDAGIALPRATADKPGADGPKPPRVSRVPPAPKRRWIATGVLAAAMAAILFVALRPDHNRVYRPPDDDSTADELREAGLAACRMKAWVRCLEKLDDAKQLDPAVERDPEVQAARAAAKRALAGPVPPPHD